MYAARKTVSQRVSGRVLDLGGAGSHQRLTGRAGVVERVVLDGPDDAELATLARDSHRFDHVLAICALGRAHDVRATLASIAAVLAPAGRLHFVEPISISPRIRTISRFARPMVTAAAGFRLDRDVIREIREAGFTICDIHREPLSALRFPFHHVAWGSARRSVEIERR